MDHGHKRNITIIVTSLMMLLIAGCSASIPNMVNQVPVSNSAIPANPTFTPEPNLSLPSSTPLPGGSPAPSSTPQPSNTPVLTPSPTPLTFEIGNDLTIDALRQLEISGGEITIDEQLAPGYNYQRFLASYLSEGYKIYGLLTVPFGDPPEGGFKAVVFNHGYIPPDTYRTEERYGDYVDYLARSGFVVFKIDYRGHGNSEGYPSGSYYSAGYTIDAISALKSLQTLDFVDPDGIGMWGHSMAGNLVLRAMLIEPDIKAGVIWAGAVYSYEDFANYGISDNTYQPPATPVNQDEGQPLHRSQVLFAAYGWPDLSQPYWQAVALTEHLEYLSAPLQIHHAQTDGVVYIGYSKGLAAKLQAADKYYEFYIYEGGGHNILSPYFDQAMQRTVEFFKDNL